MNKRSQFRLTATVMVIVMVLLAIIAIIASGKAKLSYTAEVSVKNGAIEGDGKQAVYIRTPGSSCSFEVKAKGDASIRSEMTVYKDSTMTDSYYRTEATDTKSVSDKITVDRESIFIVVSQSLKEGTTYADGVYKVDYTIKVVGSKSIKRMLLMFVLMAVVLILFLMILRNEDEREGKTSKKLIRLRRKAFMNGFFTLVMLILSFALLSASVDQFPFTLYQAGMISVMIAASVFFMTADQSDAYTGIRRKKGSLMLVFGIVALINLIIALFSLFGGPSSDITPIGSGIIGDWIVNFVTACCFFTMLMEMMMKNAREGGRRQSRYYDEEEDYSVPKPVKRERTQSYPDSGIDTKRVKRERTQRVKRESESFEDDIDF